MRFLLCGINAKYIHSNLAVFCLKAYADREKIAGADIAIREYTINHYVEDILQDLYECHADVIIFSCYIWNITFVNELAGELKKICPETQIWAGGPEVSYHVEEFLLEHPAIDLVMQGEGEEVFARLVRWQAAGGVKGEEPQELFRIPGIAFRAEGIVNTGPAPLMDMDRIPFVYEDFRCFSHKILYYETSRGCPFRCSYCLSSIEKTVRLRSLSLVEQELDHFLEAKVPQVKFVDRTFNCNRERAYHIWKYLEEHDNGITNFHFEISSDLLGEKELQLFSRMRPGLIQLEIGVQSTHAPTIEAIHRHMDLATLFSRVDSVHALGNIHQHLDLIAGLPFEGYGEFARSFNDLYAHEPDQLQLGFLKVLKGTVMEQDVERYGIIYRTMPPYEVLQTKWISYNEIILLKGIEELVEQYYNSGQYSTVLKYAVPFFPGPFQFFEQFSREYCKKGYHKMNHSRIEKYEILRVFLRDSLEETEWGTVDEALLYDMYLRENVKGRPAWAPDTSTYKKEWKALYRTRGEELFPKEDWEDGYDSKKAANQSHIEPFSIDMSQLAASGKVEKKECFCLFDYHRRNPLNHSARTVIWEKGKYEETGNSIET